MKRDANSGRIDLGPGRVWYQQTGAGPSLVLLHGGPGADSGYLEPLLSLADDGYTVVLYDQLGSFRSDKPDDPSLWNVDRFVKELETVRTTLELGQMHLLGQSWGAFPALE
jgi:proline iminopeptidase